jgi:tRNA A37 threonylcarbamoyladenosine dehydratase
MDDSAPRFGGIQRLLGAAALSRLGQSHVCVIGIGGVGSWAAEALGRSGVGAITLVDLDDICVTNINRQLPALDGVIGRPKVEVMAERLRAINPRATVNPLQVGFGPETAATLLQPGFDYVIDAIDSPSAKALLIAECRQRGMAVVTSGGAGGRRDPTQVRVADLALATHDHLLQETRRRLRRDHGFPRGGKARFDVACVFSPEPMVHPQPDGTVCERRDANSDPRTNCDSGFGTASFVTGVFGLVAASVVVRAIAGVESP